MLVRVRAAGWQPRPWHGGLVRGRLYEDGPWSALWHRRPIDRPTLRSALSLLPHLDGGAQAAAAAERYQQRHGTCVDRRRCRLRLRAAADCGACCIAALGASWPAAAKLRFGLLRSSWQRRLHLEHYHQPQRLEGHETPSESCEVMRQRMKNGMLRRGARGALGTG